MFTSRLRVFIIIASLIFSLNILYSQSKYFIGFSGILGQGIDNGTALDYWGGKPYESSYGFGLTIDYPINESFRIFLDANYYTLQVFQADEGEIVQSQWIFEQSDYDHDIIGPMSTDVYYFMNTTMFRLGGKYVYSIGEKTDVWYGAGVGFCGWGAYYDTSDRTQTYGIDSGFLFAPFYQMLGFDYKVKDNLKLTLFFDGGSPVADVKIDDLFGDGWTWDAEKHIMAPYRIGLAFSMTP